MSRPEQQDPRRCREEERRTSRRFQIAASAQFEWRDQTGRWQHGTGTTRDISRSGTYVETPTLPELGGQVRLVIALCSRCTDVVPVQLRGTGSVVRIDARIGHPAGFAARVEFTTIRSEQPGTGTRTDGGGEFSVSTHGSKRLQLSGFWALHPRCEMQLNRTEKD